MLASGATRSQAGSGGTAGRGKAPPAHERHQLGVALANAPLDQGAEDADGGLDREPEVAELTLGDGIAHPLERVEEHRIVFARSETRTVSRGAERSDEGELAASLPPVEGPCRRI